MRELCAWIVVVSLLAVASAAVAGSAPRTITIAWSDKPLADALSALQKATGVNYILPTELGSRLVTVSLWNLSPERALTTLAAKAGLQAEKQGDTWVISAPRGSLTGTTNPYAQAGFPGMPTMPGMGPAPGAPPGGLMATPEALPGGVAMPGPAGGFGAPPGRGQVAAPGAVPGTSTTTTTVTKPLNFIVIPLFRASPEAIGYAVGADDIIYDLGGGGQGGYGGSGYGSYGSSGYGSYGSSGYGSSGYGSSRGSRGSSGYGSSRGGSRGSSRSSSRY